MQIFATCNFYMLTTVSKHIKHTYQSEIPVPGKQLLLEQDLVISEKTNRKMISVREKNIKKQQKVTKHFCGNRIQDLKDLFT